MSLRGATDFVATWQSRGSAIVIRVLSSRLPRHLTCTFIRLFFFKKQVTIRCLAILEKGASGVRRKDSGSAEDIFGRATSCH